MNTVLQKCVKEFSVVNLLGENITIKEGEVCTTSIPNEEVDTVVVTSHYYWVSAPKDSLSVIEHD